MPDFNLQGNETSRRLADEKSGCKTNTTFAMRGHSRAKDSAFSLSYLCQQNYLN